MRIVSIRLVSGTPITFNIMIAIMMIIVIIIRVIVEGPYFNVGFRAPT